jgi:hypothetical protein
MKCSRWLLAAESAWLLLAVLPARAATLPSPAASARGVYLNGLIYRVTRTGGTTTSFSQGGSLSMQIGVPTDQNLPETSSARALVAPPSGVTTPVNSPYHVCQYSNHLYGGSMAAFNGRIYYGYTAEDCTTGHPRLYVATFDPATNAWIGNRDMGGWAGYYKYATGAALVSFNGRLWLFSDSASMSSGNPEDGWTQCFACSRANANWEPLDAITISAPGAIVPARVLIVYGLQPMDLVNYYTQLAYAVWDYDTSSVSPVLFSDPGYWSGQVSLQSGTAFLRGGVATNSLGKTTEFIGDLKSPKVQLLALHLPAANVVDRGIVEHYEFGYNAANGVFSGSWTKDPYNTYGTSRAPAADLWTYPWFAARCDPDFPSSQGLEQYIVANYLLISSGTTGTSSGFGYDSDFLVPQNKNAANNDIPITSCSETGGHNNITSGIANKDIAKSYWSLMGVVIGPPPFSVNGVTNETVIEDLSNVDFGQTTGNAIKHTQEWGKSFLLSAGIEVSTGFFGIGEVSNSFDVTYKHGEDKLHETESATAIGFKTILGTNTNFGISAPGSLGWGIFTKPNISVQDYAVHGFDYNASTGTGTYLNQDLTTMSKVNNSTTVEAYHFNLKDPGKGEVSGLFAGMPGRVVDPVSHVGGFPYSTEVEAWHNLDWESNSGPWEVKLGTGQFNEPAWNTMKFACGQNGGVSFTNSQQDVRSEGKTSSLDIKNTTEVGVDTSFGGFKAHLTVGGDSTWKTSTADTTSITNDLGANIHMVLCGPEVPAGTKCVYNLVVRPYLLRATDSTAPWIPTAFKEQRPWAITWQVDNAESCIAPCPDVCSSGVVAAAKPLAVATTAASQKIFKFGQSLPPRQASGRIVGGSGGGDSGDPLSHYSLQGGRLSWVDENGVETRIPMTADTFVPSDGVSFDINGRSWSTIGAIGKWTRSGDVWTFISGGQVQQNRVLLNLDFGTATFNLQLQKVDFQGRILAAVGDIPMNITVSGQYTFHTVLRHDFDIKWQLTQPPINNTRMQLTAFNGRYNNGAGSGDMTLEGTLPAVLPSFGDLALKMNDRVLLLPLLSMDGFREALESGGVFAYVKEGLNLKIDFANKSWSVKLNNQAFQKLLALRWGGSRIRLDVGGLPWYNQESAIIDFTADLTMHN